MSEGSIFTERDGAVAWIRLNRPERLNAFSGTMPEDLDEALRAADSDDAVRCVVITGVGRAFSTGGDISALSALRKAGDRADFEAVVRAGARVVRTIAGMRKPVIAAINGVAVGAGACLALACDLRLASESASIGLTFLRVGIHPDWGSTFFLPRLIGPAVAAEYLLTGGTISAERGERMGLINRVVPAAELEPAVRGLAGQISAAPENVVADVKRVLRASQAASLDDVLELEVQAQLAAFESPNFQEGTSSFLAKRTPRFNRRARSADLPGGE